MPTKIILISVLLLFVLSPEADAQDKVVQELSWPRTYSAEEYDVVVYQPQFDDWDNYERITAKAAFYIHIKGSETPTNYGVLYLSARTRTDMQKREVLFHELKAEKIVFPDVDESLAAELSSLTEAVLPLQKTILVSLDRVVAALETSGQRTREVEVNLEPPPIYHSESKAILVIFMGEPKFEPVKGTSLLFGVNTNWDVFLDTDTGWYYLLNKDNWLTAKNLTDGPWLATGRLPHDLKNLPNEPNWSELHNHANHKPAENPPKVIVAEKPSELIHTYGPPAHSPIPETQLMYVSNTDTDLFFYPEDGQYYLLIAGRWFRSSNVDGPWESAMTTLPDEFTKIPEDHARARVLVSVPGTPDAEAAVVLASVPSMATVNRSEVAVTVAYEGDPKFVVIDDSTVKYAINSPNDVFLVDGRYYCCYQGVWFESGSADGPWEVCTMVPQAIYDIPSTSPKHNVTYVYVYDSTPTTVTYGHTSGYTGQYVAYGMLMFGLGYAIGNDHDDWHHYHHYHYHSHYYSYGSAVRYDYYHGGYYRAAEIYGPYGGAGRGAAYNPSTGTYSRSAYRYGPSGSAWAKQAYNPYTDRYAARAGASTPYGSWGRGVVVEGNDWARAGYRSDARGTIVGAQTSEGGALLAGTNRRGDSRVVARNRDGDVYVGRDGNVYKRDSGGQWQRRSRNGWNDTTRSELTSPSNINKTRDNIQERTSQRNTNQRGKLFDRNKSQDKTSRRSAFDQLNRDFQNRQRGNSRASKYQSQRSGSRSSGRSSGQRSGGSRGGGGRRR